MNYRRRENVGRPSYLVPRTPAGPAHDDHGLPTRVRRAVSWTPIFALEPSTSWLMVMTALWRVVTKRIGAIWNGVGLSWSVQPVPAPTPTGPVPTAVGPEQEQPLPCSRL